MKHNYPGSWNDAETSRSLCERLLGPETADNTGLLADTAFPVRTMGGRIVTPCKEGELDKITDLHQRDMLRDLSADVTSLRQAAEWGMGAVEKVYKRLLLSLPFSPLKRGLLLTVIHRLFNYRVRTTGITQIGTVFMP